jgi:hypothetical protein
MILADRRVLVVLLAVLMLAAIIGALAMGPHHLAAVHPLIHYYE